MPYYDEQDNPTQARYDASDDGPDCPILDCDAVDRYEDWHACEFCKRKCCPDHMESVEGVYFCAEHAQEEKDWLAAHPDPDDLPDVAYDPDNFADRVGLPR